MARVCTIIPQLIVEATQHIIPHDRVVKAKQGFDLSVQELLTVLACVRRHSAPHGTAARAPSVHGAGSVHRASVE